MMGFLASNHPTAIGARTVLLLKVLTITPKANRFCINRINLDEIWSGLQQFRFEVTGKLSIQTMVMFLWNPRDKSKYIDLMRSLRPNQI
jgi:wyosine [tRNA(Phe)-imidazoG37] synthetase (radical SAM superfamily)